MNMMRQEVSAELALVEGVPYGTAPDGDEVRLYTVRNARGVEVAIMNYGGTIVSLKTPNRAGAFDDIVLGFDSLAPYTSSSKYFGAIVGRYGNRIAHGSFVLDGRTHALATNDGPNHLHGGARGLDKVPWHVEPFAGATARGLALRYTSPDGEEGYPGSLDIMVVYTLTDDDELVVDYYATTDRPTPVNLTQHSCFNLAGAGNGDVLDHELTIAASKFTLVDESLIPTGQVAHVERTPFDFRTPVRIGARIDADHPQLRYGHGYDHNFVLDRPANGLVFAARVSEPLSGRTLEVRTTEPGLQFYSGNVLDGVIGKGGRVYGHRTGFCLETQHFPDSPNQSSFPSTILRPGEQYRTRTVFAFGVTD